MIIIDKCTGNLTACKPPDLVSDLGKYCQILQGTLSLVKTCYSISEQAVCHRCAPNRVHIEVRYFDDYISGRLVYLSVSTTHNTTDANKLVFCSDHNRFLSRFDFFAIKKGYLFTFLRMAYYNSR